TRRRTDLACDELRLRARFRFARTRDVRRVPLPIRCARNVRLDEDGRLGATPTDLFHSLSSHGAVLHELRDQAVSRLSPDVGASRALGTDARAPLARASARVRMVLDRRSAADGSRGLAPLELAPSRG